VSTLDLGQLREELAAMQSDSCGICGDLAERMVVDHNHNTGLVRGLLCYRCNQKEGRHGDCGARYCAICAYRECPPVAHLGWTMRYSSPWSGEHLPAMPYSPTGDRMKALEQSDRDIAERLDAPAVRWLS
jgi:hypothetical protein